MKNLRITLAIIFLSMVFLISFKIYRDFIISSDLKKEEKNKLKKSKRELSLNFSCIYCSYLIFLINSYVLLNYFICYS